MVELDVVLVETNYLKRLGNKKCVFSLEHEEVKMIRFQEHPVVLFDISWSRTISIYIYMYIQYVLVVSIIPKCMLHPKWKQITHIYVYIYIYNLHISDIYIYVYMYYKYACECRRIVNREQQKKTVNLNCFQNGCFFFSKRPPSPWSSMSLVMSNFGFFKIFTSNKTQPPPRRWPKEGLTSPDLRAKFKKNGGWILVKCQCQVCLQHIEVVFFEANMEFFQKHQNVMCWTEPE